MSSLEFIVATIISGLVVAGLFWWAMWWLEKRDDAEIHR